MRPVLAAPVGAASSRGGRAAASASAAADSGPALISLGGGGKNTGTLIYNITTFISMIIIPETLV